MEALAFGRGIFALFAIFSPILMLQPKIKTYGRKSGRMSRAEKNALENLLPQFLIDPALPLDIEKTFHRIADTFVEIGFGSGDFLFREALEHPENNYIGIEYYLPGIAKLLRKIEKTRHNDPYSLANIRIVNSEAYHFLNESVPVNSLTGIYILFPDPWPKKRHHKRRLIKKEFVELLRSRLKSDGFVFVATDHEEYALKISEVFSASGYIMKDAPFPLIDTKYSRKASCKGGKIHQFYFINPASE